MRVEFFGGPLDGDVADLLDHEDHVGGDLGGRLVQASIPTDAMTSRYIEAVAARETPYVHVYKRGMAGPNGIVRLEYDGYGEVTEAPVGG